MHDDDTQDDTHDSEVYRFACCFKCLERIRRTSSVLEAILWRDICFEYILNREPLFMDDEYSDRLVSLESQGYVITHEDEDGDLLAKPLGYQFEPREGINEAFCVCASHKRRKHAK